MLSPQPCKLESRRFPNVGLYKSQMVRWDCQTAAVTQRSRCDPSLILLVNTRILPPSQRPTGSSSRSHRRWAEANHVNKNPPSTVTTLPVM
jgi:hypothetical protein